MSNSIQNILDLWNFDLIGFVRGDTIVECRYCETQITTNTSDGEYLSASQVEDMIEFACKVGDANHVCNDRHPPDDLGTRYAHENVVADLDEMELDTVLSNIFPS